MSASDGAPGGEGGIRLPELAVFKRYSLALRQEFAPADEIRSILERAISQVEKSVAQAEDQRRRAEETPEIVESYIEDDVLDDERPFWEVEEEAPIKAKKKKTVKKQAVRPVKRPAAAKPAAKQSAGSKSSKPAKSKPAKSKSTKKRAPAVVRVSERGKPIKR